MNSNNYIRKIDELGRIVIPKEVRTRLKIKDNENILISADDNKIFIKKYSYLTNYNQFLTEISNILEEIYKASIEISDQNKIIFSNVKDKTKKVLEETVIKDSITIGKIAIYTEKEEDLSKLARFLSRLIVIYLSTY